MDAEVTLPPSAQAISPLMISSPTPYAGTALLQRAMCRSRNALCYGDNLFEELLSIVEWATSLIDANQTRREIANRMTAAALERTPGKWMPDTTPAFDIHMSSIFSTIYNIPHTAQQFAAENGYDVWGMIRNDIPAALIVDLLSVFPAGKAVLVHRNPFEIARDMLRDDEAADVAALGDTWSVGMDGYLKAGHERLVKLRYEDAELDADGFAGKLAEALGIEGISGTHIDAGDESEANGTRELTDAERGIISERCGNMLAVYYPELI